MHINTFFLVALPENYIYQDELAVLLVRVALPVLFEVFFLRIYQYELRKYYAFISTSTSCVFFADLLRHFCGFISASCATSAHLLFWVTHYGNLADFTSVSASVFARIRFISESSRISTSAGMSKKQHYRHLQ